MIINKGSLLQAALGGGTFWAPSIILHAIKGSDYLLSHWSVLGLVQSSITLAMFLAMRFFERRLSTAGRKCALCMLLGIWLLGPLCMSISSTFDGGGFAENGTWLSVAIATVLFPLLTPWMSLYDGSFVGLLVSSLLLGVASLDLKRIFSIRFRSSFPGLH
jgi:hypothetical protein